MGFSSSQIKAYGVQAAFSKFTTEVDSGPLLLLSAILRILKGIRFAENMPLVNLGVKRS
jgi:hypothetical protein